MSIWRSGFDGQQLIQKIKESSRLLDSAKTDKLNTNDLANYARLLKVVKVIAAQLEHLDPELYQSNIWASIGQQMTALQNQINTFAQNSQPGFLNNANATADQLLGNLRPIERNMADDVKAIVEAVRSYQVKISEELEESRKILDDEKVAAKAINKSIEDQNARLKELTTSIEQQKGRLDNSIAKYQEQFMATENGRATAFINDSKRRADEFNQFLKITDDDAKKLQEGNKKQFEEFYKSINVEGEQHLQRLKHREEEIDRIFGAIGSSAFAGHFKKTADDERLAANWLRRGAFFLMVIMVGVAGFSFYLSVKYEVNLHTFIFRFGTMIVIAIPAVYAAQESSKHRDRENLLRKVQLELASIDSYLVLLPETQRNEIKAKLTEKFFGREEPREKEEAVSKHALFELMSSVLKNLTKVK